MKTTVEKCGPVPHTTTINVDQKPSKAWGMGIYHGTWFFPSSQCALVVGNRKIVNDFQSKVNGDFKQ